MDELINILHSENCSLVVENKGICRRFNGRGVRDLLTLLTTEKDFLNGANVADKLIGKGAAALMILGSVNNIYTDLISDSALELFNKSGKKVTYRSRVATLATCPIEALCQNTSTPEACLQKIQQFFTNKN